MEFLLVVGAVILLLLVLGARSRVKALEQRVEQLHEKIDWMYRNGPENSAAKTSASVAAATGQTDRAVEAIGLVEQEEPVFDEANLAALAEAQYGEIDDRDESRESLPHERDAAPLAARPETTARVEAVSANDYAAEPLKRDAAWALVGTDNDDADATPQQDAFEPQTPVWMLKAKEWLFGGNLVAKVGLLILFIGVSFLLKYAAARVSVPIELRLAGIVLADIGLLFWGWRIRESRPAIGLSVQGGALGILMLVTFGAFRLYHLIPGGLAFGLLFALTAFTCLLAVLQDAIWLAIFGIVGGFAAPILTSTGQGSHIGLFSYYALLNAGILAIALKRSWRLLNLLGFAFTFLIATAWGTTRYVPENYLSSQLFLVLFFVFYVAIAILYAHREAPRLKHYVDGTLVFGTPLAAFGLQYGLVHDKPYGLAFSALALGLFYIGLTTALWQRRGSALRLLIESFLALGIVFGTLAIPFALDGRWTAAAWALEGAGIVWVGLKQKQTLAWVFGVLVQVGAWASYLGSVAGLTTEVAARSNLWLGFLLLAGTGFAMAVNFRKQLTAQDDETERADGAASSFFGILSTGFLGVAAVWLLAGAWCEIYLRGDRLVHAHTLYVASGLWVALVLGQIARRLQWNVARYFALVPQVLAGLVFLALFGFKYEFGLALGLFDTASTASRNLFDGGFIGGLLLALGAGVSGLSFHRRSFGKDGEVADPGKRALSVMLLVWGSFWWFSGVLGSIDAWGGRWLAEYRLFAETGWFRMHPVYGLMLALSTPLLARLTARLEWRDLRWLAYAVWPGLLHATLCIAAQLDDVWRPLPQWPAWLALAALWSSGEWLLREGEREGWVQLNETGEPLRVRRGLYAVHAVRTVGPCIVLWQAVRHVVTTLFEVDPAQATALLDDAGWFTAGAWSRYLPAWATMACLAALVSRSRAERWPTTPVSGWYRTVVVPLGALWFLGLAVIWNLTENGQMAPLPYLPILNPLDLTTGFAALLAVAAWRLRGEATENIVIGRLPCVAAIGAYLWFNLMLLRTAAHFLDLPYQVEPLFRSQFVQAMLSLVWSATALILMRHAAKRLWRLPWMAGAALLALVVAKLFLIDLSNVGGIERIISFLGVGLLMLAIGYLAPFPTEKTESGASE